MIQNERLINANAMREDWLKNGENEYVYDTNAVLASIDAQPTIDAVEVPPIKIGDTAYFIINKKIYEAKICLIAWNQWRTGKTTEIRGEVQRYHTVSANFSDWGVTVFATKEEAERKLYPCEHCLSGTYRSCEGCSHGERREGE